MSERDYPYPGGQQWPQGPRPQDPPPHDPRPQEPPPHDPPVNRGWPGHGSDDDQTVSLPLPQNRPAHPPADDTVQMPLPTSYQGGPSYQSTPPYQGGPSYQSTPPYQSTSSYQGGPPPSSPWSVPPQDPPPQDPPPQNPPPSGRGRGRRLLARVLALVVVLGLALTAVAVVRPGPVDQWLAGTGSDPVLDPLPSDPPPSPVLAAAGQQAPVPAAAEFEAALAPLVTGSVLGSRVNISVVDVATGRSLYGRGQDTPTVPASTNKLVTALAVLATRGPTYRIATQAVAGEQPGEVVLVGGGDPTLAINATGSYPDAARLDQLAEQVKGALGGTPPTKVIVDSSLFTGNKFGPWDPDIPHNGYAGPTVALMTDGARINPKKVKPPAKRYDRPDVAAGKAFAKLLGLPASAVAAVERGTAPDGARQLGQVESIPIGRMVEIMLSESDNVIAEMLARQVALDRKQPASYAGAATAVESVLTELGLPEKEARLHDGSGFSRKNRITPSLLTGLLRLAADPEHPELHGIFSGLPVAGWSGTLRERYAAAGSRAGAGLVRAKTGTLAGVNAIAGTVVNADGRLLAFAVMADAVPAGQTAAQNALDRIAAQLVTCGCQ